MKNGITFIIIIILIDINNVIILPMCYRKIKYEIRKPNILALYSIVYFENIYHNSRD